MKKGNLILSIILIIIIFISSICIYNKNSQIKTIKSEKQLLQIYEADYGEIPFVEKMVTLPFSLLFNDNYHYKTRYYGRNYDLVEDAVNDAESTKTIGEVSTTRDYSKTNIQVEGVDEADIIKTNGNYIYSLSGNNVVITNTKDENNIKIDSMINLESAVPNDLLLYKDLLVVFATKQTGRYVNQETLVEIYNIKDSKNPKLVKSYG